MPEPIRSPKQSRIATKSRSHPYARPQQQTHKELLAVKPITRQSSLLGAIKSLVTAPLSWLSTVESRPDDGEFLQKRKDPLSERSGTPPKTKRVRRDSPDAGDQRPASYSKIVTPLWDLGNGVPPARLQKERFLRDEDGFYTSSSPPALYDRASQSIEPLDSKFSNIHIRRSTTRERSMPPPSPFARSFSRVSLTPQPTGATFGPSPKRKQRDLTAPLLSSVPPVPIFTRPPSMPPPSLFPKSPVRQMSEGPIMSLLSQSRQSRQSLSPVRETSSMLISSEATVPVSPSKAERTLSTLETFRTPLIRFPSQIYPEDRRPRKVHVPLPSKLSPDEEFRKRKVSSVTPYPTETSGLRKLLQRKRHEADFQDSSVETTDARETDSTGTLKGEVRNPKVDANEVPQSAAIPTETSVRSKPEGYSSLRAPTARLRRTHAPAPQPKKPRNKFSLKDEDSDETALNLNDLKAYESRIQKPHLSLTRRMSETGMQTEIPVKTDETPTPTQSLPAQPRSFDDLLSQINSSVVPKPTAHPPVHATEMIVSPSVEPVAKLAVEGASTKNTSSGLPFSLTSGGSVSSYPLPKPFESTASRSTVAPSVEVVTGSRSIPSFFSPAKTEFTPPPLPTNSIFNSIPSTSSPTTIEEPPEKTNANGNGTRPLPVLSVTSELLEPKKAKDTIVGSANNSTLGECKVMTTVPLPSTPVAEAERPIQMAMGTSTVGVTDGEKSSTTLPNASAPVGNTPGPFSFVFGSNGTKEQTASATSIPVTSSVVPTSATPSFTFSSPSTPAIGNAEFTFGKPTDEVAKPAVNIFNFGSTPPSLTIGGGASSTSLVTSTTLEADTQMDTNDAMEESPSRVQEKKDILASVPPPSPFGLNSPITNSPFSFGNPPAKPSAPSFVFGNTNSNGTTDTIAVNTGGFTFGQSKSTPAGSSFGFANTNPTTGNSGFNFSKPPDSPSINGFGTGLMTSTSAPAFTFGNSSFESPKVETPIPTGSSAPSSPSLFPQQTVTSSSFSFNVPSSSTSFTKLDSTNPPSSPNQPFQFGATSGAGSQQPSAIFTLGAAADTPPRKVKGLPQRRRK